VIRVTHIDHRLPETARELHAVQMAAYRQEAALLGAVRFPPLERTVADIAQSSERFLGAYLGDHARRSARHMPDEKDSCITIASLVVSPAHQRGGIARMLVSATVAQHPGVELTVQTGAGNAPALALYERFGFRECRRWRVGDPPLELVKLKRPVPGR
jgi:ribosomal protein S18 acetylase RimI-like enzyme